MVDSQDGTDIHGYTLPRPTLRPVQGEWGPACADDEADDPDLYWARRGR